MQAQQNPQNQIQNQVIKNNGNMIDQLLNFKNQLGGKNPKQIIDSLVSSGKMSPSQLNQLETQASNIIKLLK